MEKVPIDTCEGYAWYLVPKLVQHHFNPTSLYQDPPPELLNPYPPLYFYLCSLVYLITKENPPIFSTRIVSVACLFLISLMIYMLTPKRYALISSSLVLISPTTLLWEATARVDVVASAFAITSLYFILRNKDSLAILFLVASSLTKQVYWITVLPAAFILKNKNKAFVYTLTPIIPHIILSLTVPGYLWQTFFINLTQKFYVQKLIKLIKIPDLLVTILVSIMLIRYIKEIILLNKRDQAIIVTFLISVIVTSFCCTKEATSTNFFIEPCALVWPTLAVSVEWAFPAIALWAYVIYSELDINYLRYINRYEKVYFKIVLPKLKSIPKPAVICSGTYAVLAGVKPFDIYLLSITNRTQEIIKALKRARAAALNGWSTSIGITALLEREGWSIVDTIPAVPVASGKSMVVFYR